MGWSVSLSERAEHDLEQVVAFLAQKSPTAAERLGLAMVATVFSLDKLPHVGAPVRGRPGYRRILHRPWFLIYYRVDEVRQAVEIVRIWDGRQNPSAFKLN